MREFLEAIWPWQEGIYGELRMIRNAQVRQEWFGMDGLDLLAARARGADAEGWDCYMGVLPRTRAEGTANACLSETRIMWADVDSKAHDGSKAAALFSLGQAQLTPSILTDSGNGWHAFWLLRQAWPFAEVQPLMRGLQRAIGSDAVHDAPRVLRLPGTRNHKDCRHWSAKHSDATTGAHVELYPIEACKPVRLLHFDPQRQYRPNDFDDYAPEDVRPAPVRDTRGRVEYGTLPDWLRDLIEGGAPQGQRSEALFRAVMWLHRYGWDRESIRQVVDREPIGEKMAEMQPAAADRWFERTYDRAVTEAV